MSRLAITWLPAYTGLREPARVPSCKLQQRRALLEPGTALAFFDDEIQLSEAAVKATISLET